jgi:hypothetical protein
LDLPGPASRFASPTNLSVLGFSTILASLLSYQWILYSYPVETRNIGILQETAYAVVALVVVGLLAALVGATGYFRQRPSKNVKGSSSPTLTTLSLALSDKGSFRVFVLSALLYGILFGFLSSLIIYRPSGVLSDGYVANIPSALSVLCCGSIGQMPQFVIYLTQQFAILIIPMNVILLVTVSWLVGLNAGLGTFAYKNRPESDSRKWLWGLGAIVGLFTACPSCAGFFLLAVLGLAGAVGLTITLSSLQGAFIAAGLPILLITPILTSRQISSYRECSIKLRDSMKLRVDDEGPTA